MSAPPAEVESRSLEGEAGSLEGEADSPLRRIEASLRSLAQLKDAHAREIARQALQAVLDLHRGALEPMVRRLASTPTGAALGAELAREEPMRSVLLLHALHPISAEERLRRAIAELARRRFDVIVRLIGIEDGVARLSVEPGAHEWSALREEVGHALVDAAPDLDDVVIERASADAHALAST